MNKIKEWWNTLEPQKKKSVAIISVIVGLLVITFADYSMRDPHTVKRTKLKEKRTVSFDSKLIDKSMYTEFRKDKSEKDKKIAELEQSFKAVEQKLDLIGKNDEPINAARPTGTAKKNGFPDKPVPVARHSQFVPPPPGKDAMAFGKPAVQMIGDIEISANPALVTSAEEDKKKVKDTVYLTPSFMEATLLSGLLAPTMEDAKGHPAPVMLRIKDLAVLPNRVKADLKGCFVLAEGYGDLSKERADMRLVSLSCISKNGEAVIDQKVKGYLVDADALLGLKGRVVSKMGAALARSVMAGIFEGLGEAFEAASTSTSVSSLGVVETVDKDEIVNVAVGRGVARGAQELQKFYLDLARQTMPVIEVLPTKGVTVVVSEGVELEIKEYCAGGNECKG